ncbi:MAG: response regulator transcription factor [Anaerolineales bacterium]
MKIFLVEDHPLTLRGIQDVLEDAPEIEIIGTACMGKEALEKITALQPDIVVLDYQLPDMRGSDIAAEIRQQGWAGHLMVLSAYGEPEIVHEMLQAGARAYLLKTGMVHELIFALRSVVRGKMWFSPEVWELLAHREVPNQLTDSEEEEEEEEEEEGRLTARQLEILQRVALGRTDGQIAVELGVTMKAINKQLARILERLHAPNRANAVYKATKKGWI